MGLLAAAAHRHILSAAGTVDPVDVIVRVSEADSNEVSATFDDRFTLFASF